MNDDARAKARKVIAVAIHSKQAHWHAFEACQQREWYLVVADAVLDALTDDDLTDLLIEHGVLRWQNSQQMSPPARRLASPWEAAP